MENQQLIKELIANVEEKSNQLEQQIDDYMEIIEKLCNTFHFNKFRYYPNSFNGRKVTFGVINYKQDNLKDMVTNLIICNQMENFISYLTKVVIPLFLNNQYADDFHF